MQMFQQLNSRRVQRPNSEASSLNEMGPLNKVLSIESLAKVPVSLRVNIQKNVRGSGAVRLHSQDDGLQLQKHPMNKSTDNKGVQSPNHPDISSLDLNSANNTHSTAWRKMLDHPSVLPSFGLEVVAPGQQKRAARRSTHLNQSSDINVLAKDSSPSVSAYTAAALIQQTQTDPLSPVGSIKVSHHAASQASKRHNTTTPVIAAANTTNQSGQQQSRHKVLDSSMIASRVRKLKELLLPVETTQDQMQRSKDCFQTGTATNRDFYMVQNNKRDQLGSTSHTPSVLSNRYESNLRGNKITDVTGTKSLLGAESTITQQNMRDAFFLDEMGGHSLLKKTGLNLTPKKASRSRVGKSQQHLLLSSVVKPLQRNNSRLTSNDKAPITEKIDLRGLQNLRLNEMRQQMKDKVRSRLDRNASQMSQPRRLLSPINLKLDKLVAAAKATNERALTQLCPITNIMNKIQEDKSVETRKSTLRENNESIILKAMQESAGAPKLTIDQQRRKVKNNSVNIAEYNAATRLNLRPIEFADVPLMIDHIGLCAPHPLNLQPKSQIDARIQMQNSIKKEQPDKVLNFDLQPTHKPGIFAPITKKQTENLSAMPNLTSSIKQIAKVTGESLANVFGTSLKVPHRQSQVLKKPDELHNLVPAIKKPPPGLQHAHTQPINMPYALNRGKRKPKKSEVNYDNYGCKEEATQEEQVQAIVDFFQQIFNTGTMKVPASKPKPRVEDPRICRSSMRKLNEFLAENKDNLARMIRETSKAQLKQHSQIFLGAFDESSIKLYEELDKLKTMLDTAKSREAEEQFFIAVDSSSKDQAADLAQRLAAQQKQRQKDQEQIENIFGQIQHVLAKISDKGPSIPDKLRSFISVEQMVQKEHPDHLPDIQKEGAKILEMNPKRNMVVVMNPNRRISSLNALAIQEQADKLSDKKDEPLSNFFKPYERSQVIIFPEQARIQNKRLLIYHYELGDGLVDAISHRIEQTKDPNEVLCELILDQNNLSDANLARIIEALFNQSKNYRQSCQSINISNNEFGGQASASLLKFFSFQSPEHLQDLRLSNLKLPDVLISDLFGALEFSVNLLKLCLSNINLKGCSAMDQMCEFLANNDMLTDLDLSYCQFSIEQMTQIFIALKGTLCLTNLNIAFNTNEYARYPMHSQKLDDAMIDLFEQPLKLVHLDLSGLNLGEKVLVLGPSLVKSLSLQSIHLHNNNIEDVVKQELYDIFRIRLGIRSTKTDIQDQSHGKQEQMISPLKDKSKSDSRYHNIAEEGQIDKKEALKKISDLRRDNLRLEATQFHGVGRRAEVNEKLLLLRILGHQELNLFHEYNVAGWQVSPTDSCYICEGWKYTIFFYDRRRHIKNKLLDCVSRWILERLNFHLGSDHKRRVSPTITAPSLIPTHNQLPMGNTLEFVARMNRTVCYLLEQAQINASRPQCPYDILLKCYLQNKVNVADNIALSMDLDVNDLISKSLLYPDDSEVIDLPDQSNYFSREMEDDQTFIWAGFAKPGKHTVTIHDPLNLDGVVKQTFLVGVRKKELLRQTAPQIETEEAIMKQGASRLDSTILFSNWKRDKSNAYDQCFNFDWSMISLANLNTSKEQLLEVQQIIKQGYPEFIKAHSILASHSASYPLIDRPRFEVFVNKLHLMSSTLTIEACFKIFTRCGMGKDLNRPQLLKAVLHVVFAKYLRPKAQLHMQRMIKRMSSTVSISQLPSDFTISDMSGGVRHFFEKVIPKFSSKRTWQEFRKFVQKPKTSQILINAMTALRRVYSQWSEIVNNKRRFTIQHNMKLFDFIKNLAKKHPLGKNLVISDFQLMSCWGLSKITVKDMDRDYERTQHMVFVEFLEFLCRVAHVAQFIDIKPVSRIKYDSSCGEDEETFIRPELSQSSDKEDMLSGEHRGVLNYDSESSEDSDFVTSELNTQALQNFTFLFHRSSMKAGDMGKKHRVKLRWLLSLLPAVLKSYAKKKEEAEGLQKWILGKIAVQQPQNEDPPQE